MYGRRVLKTCPATLLKKRLWHRCFTVNFAKFLRTLFFNRTPPVAASGRTIILNLADDNNVSIIIPC